MKGPITEPVFTRLTPEDHASFTNLAQQADCSIQQLARYALRRFIHDKLKEAPAETGA